MRALVCAATLALVVFAACSGESEEEPGHELRAAGDSITAELAGGEVHRYPIPLEQDQFLAVEIEQQGVDLVAELFDPAGNAMLRADRAISDRGPERLLAVAPADGAYSLTLTAGRRSGRYRARILELRPATGRDRRVADTYQRFLEATALRRTDLDEAVAGWSEALEVWRELGEAEFEGEVLHRLGSAAFARREYRQATELYLAAAAAFARIGSRRWESIVRGNAGASLIELAQPDEALVQYGLSLDLARSEADVLNQAKAHNGLGLVHENRGELQQALDHYEQALELWDPESSLRPHTLHNLGVLLGGRFRDSRRGRGLLIEARDAWATRHAAQKIRTLNQLGKLDVEEGRYEEARGHFEQALALQEDDPCAQAVTLARLAVVEGATGAPAGAEHVDRAFGILDRQTCMREEPTVHLLGAERAAILGDPATASARYRRCQEIFSDRGDRTGLAECLAGLAHAERALGSRRAALEASQQALDILESVRPRVLRTDLRTGFFTTAHDLVELQIHLWMELEEPGRALLAAERGRARALQDLLVEAGAGLRSADPALAAQAKSLQTRLNGLETQRLKLRETTGDRAETLRRQIDALVRELESVRGEMRRGRSEDSGLFEPRTPSVEEIQALLDEDTLLLEYRLGEAASTVWAVDRDTLEAFPLPPALEIERVAMEAASWIRSLEWPGEPPQVLCELSRILLGPVASRLAGRRLVLVPDGALENLSFAALPVPDPESGSCATAPPLVAEHEIAYLPSASTLAVQRARLRDRPPAPEGLAVVADPVYDPDDGRFQPLPHSGDEADALLAVFPSARVFTGPAASRETVLSDALAGFRVVHFATHGVLDPQRPLLSHLALSQLDAKGQPIEGVLPAHEIYDLDLPAELVVLSACDTALGRQIPGEGQVAGLPRAFLHAGAARVLVSLWDVEDASTRDLMARFYEGLMTRSLPPAEALREAQLALHRAGSRPNQWAGFVLQGDWRPFSLATDFPD